MRKIEKRNPRPSFYSRFWIGALRREDRQTREDDSDEIVWLAFAEYMDHHQEEEDRWKVEKKEPIPSNGAGKKLRSLLVRWPG